MTHDAQLLLLAAGAVVALILLIARFRVHPFIALVVVSLLLGAAAGMPLGTVVTAFQEGVGTAPRFIQLIRRSRDRAALPEAAAPNGAISKFF